MSLFSVNSTFITFLAVVGPPKVLLSFGRLAGRMRTEDARRVAALSCLVAGLLGVAVAYTARYVTDFFHVTDQSLELGGGLIFFCYALGLVLGTHGGGASGEQAGPDEHVVAGGIREMLVPFVVSPLSMTAIIVESLSRRGVGWETKVAAGFLAVVVINALCMIVLIRVFQHTHTTPLEVLSRLLGLLLAGVGVELVLNALGKLGVPLHPH